jgi:hypothetical protein
MTMKEHLARTHAAIAEHHRAMAKCHSEAMGKAADAQRTFHKTAQAHHEAAAEEHDGLCQECEKAAAAEELAKNQVVPSRVSAVAPPPNLRSIPRFGHPEAAAGPANVPMQFQKLVQVDEVCA